MKRNSSALILDHANSAIHLIKANKLAKVRCWLLQIDAQGVAHVIKHSA